MKVLLLRGNPRAAGLTGHFADLFAAGLADAGAEVADVRLDKRRIETCRGCYHCWLETPGRCVFRDDMDELLPLLEAAEVVVAATPLYFYSMSSILKAFFERTFPLLREGQVETPRGMIRNPNRDPARWGRKSLVALVVGAFPHPEAAAGAVESFRLIADGTGMAYGGALVRPESYLVRFRFCRPVTIKRVEMAFRTAGREAGGSGVLTPETMKAAGQPIAVDRETYARYSDIFWEYARSAGAGGLDLERVVPLVNGDPRILMREMIRGFDPAAAAGLKAGIRFAFSDPPRVFRVDVDGGACRLAEESGGTADLTVSCATATWVRLATGELDPRQALRDGLIALAGNRALFARLPRLFPPPSG